MTLAPNTLAPNTLAPDTLASDTLASDGADEDLQRAEGSEVWSLAMTAAALFAVDPFGLGGVALRARSGPARDRWLETVKGLLPADMTVRKLPPGVSDDRLIGGLDLAATLKAGRPIAESGVLAQANGGVLIIPMAERVAPVTVAHVTAALDHGAIAVERDGLSTRAAARFGAIALDEGAVEDESPAAALMERLAVHLDLTGLGLRDLSAPFHTADNVVAARARLEHIPTDDRILNALCETGLTLGVDSLRVSLLALAVARAAAALDGRAAMDTDDALLAARLVLGPRATRLPMPEPQEEEQQDNPAEEDQPPEEDSADPPPEDPADSEGDEDEMPAPSLEDLMIEAAKAAMPDDVLAKLASALASGNQMRGQGKSGAVIRSLRRGRPAGTRRGEPGGGVRLNVVETLRAAAPWQPVRRRAAGEPEPDAAAGIRPRVRVQPEDFRVTRFKHRTETLTIFVVDASGSSALNRLAEAKGAVELLLADCYVRRDEVALVAFRGAGAEILLPPTRSLVRAKRSLAGLPGGGGTPLAAGLDAAAGLADAARRRGQTPVLVVMTDGRANIARDGTADRKRAGEEALASARTIRAGGLGAIVVDTSPRRHPDTPRLAAEMGARYLSLPRADSAALSGLARDVSAAAEASVA